MMTENERMLYATAEPEERYRLCSTAHSKIAVVKSILARHSGEPTLVIGAYLISSTSWAPNSTPGDPGSTKNAEREALFEAFRRGEVKTLVAPRSRTSPSTYRKPRWPFRFREPSARARRRRSGWAGCCDPARTTVAARCSTRSWPATAWTPSTPRIGSASLAEQGYGYVIRDADDLLGPAI